jgi:HTH-type transcriptional regulator, competence development regulator
MAPRRKHIGELIREKRLAKQITLRRFAEMLNVSPTYVSQFEQGEGSPLAPARLAEIAKLLGENPDELIALAGRVPNDISEMIAGDLKKNPQEMATFLREASGLTPEQLKKLTDQARKMKGQQI